MNPDEFVHEIHFECHRRAAAVEERGDEARCSDGQQDHDLHLRELSSREDEGEADQHPWVPRECEKNGDGSRR
jgi:hypothetical protein